MSAYVHSLKTHAEQISQRKPEDIQFDSRPSLSARKNDRTSSDKCFFFFSACDLQGSILPLSTSTCAPVFLFVNILPSSQCTFYPLPNASGHHPCSSVVKSARCVVWLSLRCLSEASMSSRWLKGGLRAF